MSFNIAQFVNSAALAAIKSKLGSDEVVNHIQAQLSDLGAQAKLNDDRAMDADKLAADTIRVYQSFDHGNSDLQQLGDQQAPWTSKWQGLHTAYMNAVKNSLAVDKTGISYFGDFNTQVIAKIVWDEEHFEEAKALITSFVNNPTGPQLEQGSANASQNYTDNRRDVTQFKDDFTAFVAQLTRDNVSAQERLNGDVQALQAKIEEYESTINQLKRALTQIAGIPSWMTWAIAEILDALGLSSVDATRRALDQNYAEEARLKDEQTKVRSEANQVNEMNIALARAQGTLVNLSADVSDIDGRLDSFAKEWAELHHDIVTIQQEMQAAADSATKRSLVSRLKLMGGSVEALITAMNTYVNAVEASGVFK